MQPTPTLDWEAYEYEFFARDRHWFVTISLATLALILVALLLKNILFAVLLAIGGFALMMHGTRLPDLVKYRLSPKGVRIHDQLFPYERLHSFWVHDEGRRRQIIIQVNRLILPHLVLPLPDEISDEQAREFLLQYLPEEHHDESLADMLFDYLGF